VSYYPTLDEDLARAKAILAKGQPSPQEQANFTPEVIEALRKVGNRTISGADIYAAYKLLESFVAEIESLRQECDAQRRAANHWFTEANRDHNDLEHLRAAMQASTETLETTTAELVAIHAEIDQLRACPVFRPDHNGECGNCDERIDAHTPAAIEAGRGVAGANSPKGIP